MSKRTKVLTGLGIGVVVLVIAVLVGSRLYGNWVNSNAEEAPTLGGSSETTETAQTDSSASAQGSDELAGEYAVSAGSFAGYRVEEVLNGQDVTVTGRTEEVSGAVTIDDGALTAGTIEVDLTTVSTPEAPRDEYFRTQALETDEFPTATFELTEPVAVALDGGDIALVGDLTIHGVTQAVTVTAQAAAGGEGLQVVGSAPITFADYDVQAPDLGFVVVEEAGAIEFSLELAAG